MDFYYQTGDTAYTRLITSSTCIFTLTIDTAILSTLTNAAVLGAYGMNFTDGATFTLQTPIGSTSTPNVVLPSLYYPNPIPVYVAASATSYLTIRVP
jgi:hypothetical protein